MRRPDIVCSATIGRFSSRCHRASLPSTQLFQAERECIHHCSQRCAAAPEPGWTQITDAVGGRAALVAVLNAELKMGPECFVEERRKMNDLYFSILCDNKFWEVRCFRKHFKRRSVLLFFVILTSVLWSDVLLWVSHITAVMKMFY